MPYCQYLLQKHELHVSHQFAKRLHHQHLTCYFLLQYMLPANQQLACVHRQEQNQTNQKLLSS